MQEASRLGCESFQIFAGNPRGWARKPLDPNDIARFRSEFSLSTLGPMAVHLAYLPNLASGDPALYEKSILCLGEDFLRANQLGADFFVVHPGKGNKEQSATVSIKRAVEAIQIVLNKVEGPTCFLLENQAGAGHEIAGQIEELSEIIRLVDCPERMGVCFDTCHGFAAGYELRTGEGWSKLTREIEAGFGMKMLKLLHLNDAKGDLGSHLDRHEHWGEGFLGAEAFRQLLKQPVWCELPGILETPVEKPGDEQRDLTFLRSLMVESK